MMVVVVVLDELELLTGCTVVVDELELLDVVGCAVVVVVGTSDEVLLEVVGCTVVVVGTSDEVLLEVVGCTVVVVVGTSDEVLLEVVGCTVVVVGMIDEVLLDVLRGLHCSRGCRYQRCGAAGRRWLQCGRRRGNVLIGADIISWSLGPCLALKIIGRGSSPVPTSTQGEVACR